MGVARYSTGRMAGDLKDLVAAEEKVKGRKLTKNEKNRLKSKLSKAKGDSSSSSATSGGARGAKALAPPKEDTNVEYVSENLESALASAGEMGLVDQSAMEEFKNVFTKFAKAEDLVGNAENRVEGAADSLKQSRWGAEKAEDASDSDSDSDSDSSKSNGISNRQMKKLTRMTVAELKQRVEYPELVEAHDIASPDPEMLLAMKSNSKTVAVPRHWSQKRKYLHGGRGREKPPYTLPDFIEETGISRMKDSLNEEEEKKKAKSQARERVRPSVGKIDIDYQVLHDAFFKHQTKPRITSHGDIYYENKEYESCAAVKDRKPGQLSARLLEALGVDPAGPVARNPAMFCPPWLMNQQRYGPPPSYPKMKIPGLNAPIPTALGARYGYHPGDWGKPPVDEYGRPLYGDAFGTDVAIDEGEEVVDRTHWGEYEPDDGIAGEADDSDSEEEEAAALEGIQGAGQGSAEGGVGIRNYRDITADASGWGVDSATGLPVPPRASAGASAGVGEEKENGEGEGVDRYLSSETISLRKRAAGQALDKGEQQGGAEGMAGEPKALYTVVQETAAAAADASGGDKGTLFGSAVTYSLEEGKQAQSVEGSKQEGDTKEKKEKKESKEKKRKRVEEEAGSKFKNFKF